MKRTYSELMKLKSFEERFHYVELKGSVGKATFGYDRWMNQHFYTSPEWRRFKRQILIRDEGCDLGCDDHPIYGSVIVHHLNPITKEQIINHDPAILDPENVISVSSLTHNALHYGDIDLLPSKFVERRPYDTCPWREQEGEIQNGSSMGISV